VTGAISDATGGAASAHDLAVAASAHDVAAQLANRLRGEVRFDGAHRALYAADSSNYRHVPIGVVFPAGEDDILATLELCRQSGLPVLVRGAGTSLAGQACNEAVVLDTSRHLNRILDIDPSARLAVVEPGVVLDDLRRQAERFDLTFGPDPATHAWCTLGGMVGNNSCGTHGLYAGKTVDNVERLRVATYRGELLDLGACDEAGYERVCAAGGGAARIHASLRDLITRHGELVRRRFPRIPRRVSGYNLDELLPERGFHVARSLVGSESTCAVVTQATVRLIHSPRQRRLVVLGYRDVYSAADAVPDVLGHNLLGLEGFDDVLVGQMRAARLNLADLSLLPEGRGWLIAEVGSDDAAEADAIAGELARARHGALAAARFTDLAEQAAIWRIRESGLGATARPPGRPPNYEGWEDAAVAPEHLGAYLRGIRELWARYGYSGAWYGHFGQGCVHTRNNFDFGSSAGLQRFRRFVEEAADLCVSFGGSLSGEHGDGQARGELLEKMYGSELVAAFREFRAIWDPDVRMNPGRIVDARPLDADLRHGPSHRSVSLGRTRFSLLADGGDLQAAAERCVGVGRCRRDDTGVMCPSYRVTRDEMHSTRGRARLLAEMFQGEVVPASWRNEAVFEALELCLSCKGCAVDCPTHVDMATYKAEFLFHYYRGRLRPVASYALGLLPWWVRAATRAPQLANGLLGDHLVGRSLKRLGGISPDRPAPVLARRSLRRALDPTVSIGPGDASVVLWPDTFSDAYEPERARAADRLLRAAGETVAVPRRWACCGRPLYDMGMLTLARRALTRVLDILQPFLQAGTPVVVVEPSCLATFRDELPDLLAGDRRAPVLAGLARSLAEHLEAIDWRPEAPLPGAHAVVHPHCHQRATAGTAAERRVLARAGCTVEVLDVGCCGLAGSFGFRREHDALSRRIGEDKFAPALRDLSATGELVVDGFSCRTQACHLGAPAGSSLAELLLRTTRPAGGGRS
jgi:FAD/FMN-containing dehydrogenase/Fe-S oxidoreductase